VRRVQDGWTPLHLAAASCSSEAVVLALLAAYPEAAKATDKVVRRPRPYVPRSCGLSPARRPPCCSAALLLAVCATYSSGTRPSTAPLGTAHRCRWFRRSSQRTRRPPRRRPRYATNANIGGATAARAPVCCAFVVRASRPPSASPLTTLSLRRRRPPRARAAGRQDAGRLRHQVQWERRGQGLLCERQGAPDSRAVGRQMRGHGSGARRAARHGRTRH